MKTIFAIIGFVVVGLWVYHASNNKTVRSGAKTVWNLSAPYINNAVNKAHDSAKQAANQ